MRTLIIRIAIFFVFFSVNSQVYKFGKVSKEELEESYCKIDSSIGAEVIYKRQKVYVDRAKTYGFRQINEIHERIKIYNKNGFNWATKKLRLYYVTGSNRELVQGLKGYTYNLDNGKIIKEKLSKNGIFNNTESDRYKTKTFTMPNVKEGSVIEYTYKIGSPYREIDDVHFQYTIPIKRFDLEVVTSDRYVYSRMFNPRSDIIPRISNTTRNKAGFDFNENVLTSTVINVPPLIEEPYVNNIYNYRSKLIFELISIKSSGHTLKNYATSWEDVVKDINESSYFGHQINKIDAFKEEVNILKSSVSDKSLLMKLVYDYVRDRMVWNGLYGKYARNIKKAHKEKKGSVPEINLMLVAMLKAVGLKANPVLISTKNKGIPLIPTIDGFNYVIACVELNGKNILLDASEKYGIPGLLPLRAINWEGILVLKDGGFRKINLYPETFSQANVMLSLVLNDDGSIKGKQRTHYTKTDALRYRREYKNYSKEEYEEVLMNRFSFDEILDFDVKNIVDLEKPIIETVSFEIDEGFDVIGDNIYISPLFFLQKEANPFKLNKRKYPIDFGYPFSRKKMINIKIPEGYQVSSMPESLKIALPDNMGSFLFNVSKTPEGFNVMSTFKINTAIIPAHKYFEIKEFYNQRVAKEAEKVVLSRK